MSDPRQHREAWRVPSTTDPTAYGVLVRIDGKHSYWWLLCPASATLYTDDKYEDCSIGDECDWDDVHADAFKLRVSLSAATDMKEP